MNIEVVNKINLSKVSNLVKDNTTGEFAAKEWHRIYEDYVPYRDGELYRNVTFKPWEITHNAPYSVYVYNGKDFNFRTDPHSKASAKWDERAIQEKEDKKLVQAMQRYIDRKL